MDTICILLIDLDLNSCPEDHSKQLTRLLCDASYMKPSTVRIITCSYPETLSTFPDLVVLRLSDIEKMSAIVRDLKRKLCTVPFLGLLCTGQKTLSPAGHALLVRLDDFITCPFRDIDILLRMQRLLQDQEAPGGAINMPPLAGILAQLPHFGLVGESRPFLEVLE